MTDSNQYIKWFCRACLLLLGLGMSYIVLLPGFSFVSWVPHELLRSIDMPYPGILMIEENLDKLIHFIGAFCITLLCIHSSFAQTPKQHIWYLTTVYTAIPAMMILAEFAQLVIGRSFSVLDIAVGILGFYFAIRWDNYLKVKNKATYELTTERRLP